jgi:hypothetical protein
VDDAAPDSATTVEAGEDSNPTETGATETGPLGDGTESDGRANPD